MKGYIIILSIFITGFYYPIKGQSWDNVTIYTPLGTAVNAMELLYGDLSDIEKEDYKDYWLNEYSNRITFLREATLSYNCHAYAWHVSEGGDTVWINTPNDDVFWNDGSFIPSTSTEGTKVSFADDDHSAVTTAQTGYFISKFGKGPLFLHAINDCPYTSTTLNYYKITCLPTNIHNKFYSSETKTETGCDLKLSNIAIYNNSNITFDAEESIYISNNFIVQAGSNVILK